jgi:hypothetical protein
MTSGGAGPTAPGGGQSITLGGAGPTAAPGRFGDTTAGRR